MTTNRLPRNRENPFVVISASLIRNTELRAIEKQVIEILLSLPDGWQPCAIHLSGLMYEGTAAIQRAINRLKELGYLVCHSIRDKYGRFMEWAWTINEAPNLPDAGNNLDVYGHVVTFDRPESASTNLRKVAKNKGKKAQQSKTETHAVSDFYPDLDFPELDNGDRSNIDTSNIQEILEREGAFKKDEIVFQEEKESQTQEFRQEVEDRSHKPVQEIICTPVNQEDFWVDQEIEKLDQFSATVESAKPKVEVAYAKVESASEWDKNELRDFQEQLKAYGVKSGKKNPSGWAFTITRNLTQHGVPSPYWEEFKAGVAIGTGDRREWESEPGVACEAVLQCLKERFLSKPGTTPAEAAIQVGRLLESPRQMEILWQAIKDRVVFLRDECRRLAKVGVQYPALDPWLTPKRQASSEDAISALQELHQYQTPQLQSGQPEVLAIASGEECQEKSPALATTAESRTAPEYEMSEEECRANIARISALCRGEKLEFAKVERVIAEEQPPSQGEDEFGDIGW